MNAKQETTETYNRTATQMADKFRNIGARIEDIEKTFSLLNKVNPFVVEIGCGDGRDAKEIVKHTDYYLGLDISPSMIELAKEHVPEASFVIADVETFIFPDNIDIIFSFASLLHSDKGTVKDVLDRVYKKLNVGGLFFISLKRDYYQSKVKKDEFGTRTFYFYQPDDIKDMLDDKYKIVLKEEQSFQNQNWFTLILQRE